MTEFFDQRESLDPSERTALLFEKLPTFLAEISSAIPGWSKKFAGIDLASINTPDRLAELPILRKAELMDAQKAQPPFGGFVDETLLEGSRIFMSPGPVWEPQGQGPDPWHSARSLYAAGFRSGDRILNALSYHFTPGGFVLDEGARALGATVFPAGVGNTEQQVEAAAVLKPAGFTGTPDFLKVLLDKAEEMGKDLTSITKAMVSGGALFPSLREEYRQRGVSVMQSYATADLGVIAFETKADGTLCEGMVCSEDMIVEIVRPGTNQPVETGEVGELVVTSFNRTYPLIRFGTGDLSATLAGPSPCGRTNTRIAGWMGRADQRTKIKGMFVDPKQVDELIKASGKIEKARLTVTREGERDSMELQVVPKVHDSFDPGATEALLTTITKLKGTVKAVSQLPNDGKVIDDQRDYSA